MSPRLKRRPVAVVYDWPKSVEKAADRLAVEMLRHIASKRRPPDRDMAMIYDGMQLFEVAMTSKQFTLGRVQRKKR